MCLQASAAPTAGQKRPRPSDSFVPVHKQRPRFSASCLAQLCTAIANDGLLPLPDSYDVSKPDHHAQLAKETGFRACVLRSCASLLEDAQAAAASALLLQVGELALPASSPYDWCQHCGCYGVAVFVVDSNAKLGLHRACVSQQKGGMCGVANLLYFILFGAGWGAG